MFGPVPVSEVLGRAWLRYWPLPVFGPLIARAPAHRCSIDIFQPFDIALPPRPARMLD